MSTPSPVPHAGPIPGVSTFRTSYPPLAPQMPNPPVPQLGDLGNFWGSFDRANDEYERDMINPLKVNIDNLLIFAALLSVANSAFLVLSIPVLSRDAGEETNRLLRLLVQGVDNSTLAPGDIGPPPFAPSGRAIAFNTLFTISLTCSMLVALSALFGQQWIASYQRRPAGGFKKERWERQRRLHGAERWRLEPLLEVLPSILQISLVVFLFGMIIFLHSLSATVALPNFVILLFGLAALLASIYIPLFDPYSPFKTPLSRFVSSEVHLILSGYRGTSLYWNLVQLKQRWFPQQKRKAVLGYSIQRILSTSTDLSILLNMALNIPLITDTQTLDAIYTRKAAMSNLAQLFETQSSQFDDRAVYSIAICHLLLAAQHSGNYARTNGLLGEHESLIILTAAQAHISNPDSYISTLPSSIITVALAHLLSDKPNTAYLEFLERPIFSASSPDAIVATLAWILVSAPSFIADDQRRWKIAEELGFENPPPSADDGNNLFCHASEVYSKFITHSAFITDGALKCVAVALESQTTPLASKGGKAMPLESQEDLPMEAARPLLAPMLQGLVYILNDLCLDVKDLETLARVFNALACLLPDSELDTKATSAMCAILSRTRPLSSYRIAVDPAALKELETRAGVDDEVKRCIDAYNAP